jgi:hypothetical protein
VLRLLRGESLENLWRELNVPEYRLERWREGAPLFDGRERKGDLMSAAPTQTEVRTTKDLLLMRDRIISEASTHLTQSSKLEEAIYLLRELEFTTIDKKTLELTDPFLRRIAGDKKVIASFDARRMPSSGEIIIIYGNYPHMFENLVINNPIKRHVADFWSFEHHCIEYDRRWDGVDQIYLINADERRDRLDAVLRELASGRAPFHRVTRVSAIKSRIGSTSQLKGRIGCLQSHIEVLRRALTQKFEHILVLEDDFCFTSEVDTHLSDLQKFFDRSYNYWVCLIATSKYGQVIPQDDLVSLSFQECTNAAGYLVSREGMEQVLAVREYALERLKATEDQGRYANDRSWTVLQSSGKFLVFNKKFGFQTASISDIEGTVSRYLD